MRLSAAIVCVVGVAFAALSAYGQSSGGFRTSSVPDASGNLTGRIEKLEEQVVDLQGVVAGVETLAKSGGGGSGPGPSSGGASSDQVRQLSAQVADLAARLQRLETQLGSSSTSARPASSFATTAPAPGFEDRQQLPPVSAQSGRGSQSAQQPSSAEADTRPPRQTAAADPAPLRPAGPSSSGAQALYDQGSSALSRKEYASAEGYFNQLLEQYPADGKAGLAQFWLGESAFASGDYRAAADRFLKAFNNYQASEKAPEALLKLAISLRRIGENTAACESFAELGKRFPQASKSISQRAETEKRRANCT